MALRALILYIWPSEDYGLSHRIQGYGICIANFWVGSRHVYMQIALIQFYSNLCKLICINFELLFYGLMRINSLIFEFWSSFFIDNV